MCRPTRNKAQHEHTLWVQPVRREENKPSDWTGAVTPFSFSCSSCFFFSSNLCSSVTSSDAATRMSPLHVLTSGEQECSWSACFGAGLGGEFSSLGAGLGCCSASLTMGLGGFFFCLFFNRRFSTPVIETPNASLNRLVYI